MSRFESDGPDVSLSIMASYQRVAEIMDVLTQEKDVLDAEIPANGALSGLRTIHRAITQEQPWITSATGSLQGSTTRPAQMT
jgi:hypothetical protein